MGCVSETRWRVWTTLASCVAATVALSGCGGGGGNGASDGQDAVRDLTGRWGGIVAGQFGDIDVTQDGRVVTLVLHTASALRNTVFRGTFNGERIIAESGDYIMELTVSGERMFGYIGLKGEEAWPPSVSVTRRTTEVPEN